MKRPTWGSRRAGGQEPRARGKLASARSRRGDTKSGAAPALIGPHRAVRSRRGRAGGPGASRRGTAPRGAVERAAAGGQELDD